MKSRLGSCVKFKLLIVPLAAMAVLFGGVVTSPNTPVGELLGSQDASAGAQGCSWWNVFKIKDVPIPSGQYCVTLVGSGRFVADVRGGYVSASRICYTSITAEFFDTNWKHYKTYETPRHNGCANSRTTYITLNRYVSKGFMCSTLKTGGSRITSKCFGIV